MNEYTQAVEVIYTVLLITHEDGDDYNMGAASYYYCFVYSDLEDYRTYNRYIKNCIPASKRDRGRTKGRNGYDHPGADQLHAKFEIRCG